MYGFFSQLSYTLSQPFITLFYSAEGIPILAAFLLGIVGALAPCQFTGNLGAITLYGNSSVQRKIAWMDVFLFITGKVVVFSVLGLLIWLIGSEFKTTLTLYFPWIRKLIGPMLIIIGLFMIGMIKIRLSINLGDNFFGKSGRFGSFLMGVSFSLGFCPTMFTLFFITLMPMALASSYGFILPTIFAIGTSLPLLIVMLLIWYFDLSGKLMKKKGRKLGAIVQKIAGIFMILIGILDTLTYWL